MNIFDRLFYFIKHFVLDWFTNRPFEKFLEEANLEKWSSIGIGISMEKLFKPALMALKKWKNEFPKRVHFFVIDPAEKQIAEAFLEKCRRPFNGPAGMRDRND